MKSFLFKCRKSIVLVLELLMYFALAAVLFAMLSINNPQVLRISRTSAIMLVMFFFSCYMLARVYGKYDIDVRKSKPIIISIVLSVLLADAVTFVMMIIMNTNVVTNNEVYPYLGEDILWTLAAFLLQIPVAVLFTYGGNAIYFSIVPPENCLVITAGGDGLRHLIKGVEKYKKQYRITKIIRSDDPGLYEEINLHDSVFLDGLPYDLSGKLQEYCYSKRKNVYRTPEVPDLVTQTSELMLLGDETIIRSFVKEKNMHQRIVKRLADIVISAAGLVITSPLLLICAVLIKAEDGGHVIFSQNRVTISGRFFKLYKLRTMREDSGKAMVTDDDKRITKIGRFIRKFRIDEIPQFVNVIKGEMSVVGPRAEMADRVYMNVQEMPEYMYRYRMKAGITGYAQIHGKYNTSPKDKLLLDLTYIQTFSLWNDFKIILQTLFVLLRPDKSTEAYDDEASERQEHIVQMVDEHLKNGGTDEQR